MRWIKKVKTRKEWICDACGMPIRKGDFAFKVSMLMTTYQRYPDVYYYHYVDDISVEEFEKMSPDDIRDNICKKLSIEKFKEVDVE